MTNYEELRQVVKDLEVELGTELSLGYIGNAGPGYDGRSWSVDFKGMGVPVSETAGRGPWSHRASGTSYPATRSWSTDAAPSALELRVMILVRYVLERPASGRELVSVGWDGRSNPMLRYADELSKPDSQRSIVSVSDRIAGELATKNAELALEQRATALDLLSREYADGLEAGAIYDAGILVAHLIERNENGYCSALDPYILRPILKAIAAELESDLGEAGSIDRSDVELELEGRSC